MTVAERLDPFVGRATEVATLRAELAAARAGTPRVLVVQGDAGIGKTVLLEQFLTDEADLTVLRATGEQWEAYVAYGVIDQIMRVAGVSTTRLLVSRDRSFPPEEPVGVGAWILDVIKDLAQESTVVVIVDDAHWADMDSLRALLFAARRLVDERVLLVLGQRAEDEQRLPEGLRRLAGGRTGLTLALAAAAAVRRARAGLGAGRAGLLHAGGRSGCTPTPAATRCTSRPCSASCPRSGGARGTRRCPRRARSPRRCCGGWRRAARRRGASWRPSRCSAPPRRSARPPRWPGCPTSSPRSTRRPSAGLLQVREDFGIREVGFPHPLVQAAVYEQLGPLRRMQLHSAAAEFVEDEGALLRHRVLAATPPNTELAAELEAFARREAAVGAWASAAWALVEGSNLSPNREAREQRLLLAVDATVGAGDLHQAEIFARDVASFSRGAWRDAALGYLAILRGRRDEAEELLRPRLAAVRRRPGHLGGRGGGPAVGPARRRAAARRRGGPLVHPGDRAGPTRRPRARRGRGAARAGHGLAGADRRGHDGLRGAAGPGQRGRGRPAAGAHPHGARLAADGGRRRRRARARRWR